MSKLSPYLERYGEPETVIASAVNGKWDHVLCIPAFKEAAVLLERLQALHTDNPVLIVLVINAPAYANDADLVLTRQLLTRVTELPCLQAINEQASVHALNNHNSILVIDRCTDLHLLPPGQGVGLARKITGDIACRLIERQTISCPWLYCSDADVDLPAGYFPAVTEHATAKDAALLYPFHHLPHKQAIIRCAQAMYDLSLHYYVAGLAAAGSPYAFQTIGSTIAIAAQAYAKVRGFPRREAAEDFYMLNKLAKVGSIRAMHTPIIRIDSRQSDRVPFGTGAAIGKLSQLEQPLREYRYYHPGVFTWLHCWLQALPRIFSGQSPTLTPDLFDTVTAVDTPALIAILQSMDTEVALAHALKHGRTFAGFSKQIHDWFDAFRTLKFLHAVRDQQLPSILLQNPALQAALLDFQDQGLIPAYARPVLEDLQYCGFQSCPD